jgi:hypothetical protein
MSAFSELVERTLSLSDGAIGLLTGEERKDAERLLLLCRTRWQGGEETDRVEPTEVRKLSELLARRSAQAMPFGALGRALSADLHGASRDAEELLKEFQTKLFLLGL